MRPNTWRLVDTVLVTAAAASSALVLLAFRHRMSFPWDFAPGEGDHIYFTLRLIAGEPLYVANDGFPYLYNVYPPLYHLLLAPLVALVGPHLMLGQLISLLSTLGLGALLGLWLRDRGATMPLCFAAGAAAIASPTLFNFLGMGSPDALATLLGAAVLFQADRIARATEPRLVGLGVLSVAACFAKHSNPLLVVAAFGSLVPQLKKRALMGLIATGAVCALLVLAGDAMTAGAFSASLIGTVRWSKTATWKWLIAGRYLVEQAGLIALVIAAALVPRLRRAVPRSAWFGLVASAYLLASITRAGAGPQYFLPFHIAAAAVAAMAVHALGPTRAGVLAAVVLSVQLGSDAWGCRVQLTAIPDWAYAATRRMESFVRATPGPALMDRQTMLWLRAGKRDEHFVETAALGLDWYHDTWRPEALERFIAARGFGVIVLRDRSLLPSPLRPLIDANYAEHARVLLADDSYRVYVPRPREASASSAR